MRWHWHGKSQCVGFWVRVGAEAHLDVVVILPVLGPVVAIAACVLHFNQAVRWSTTRERGLKRKRWARILRGAAAVSVLATVHPGLASAVSI